MALQERTADPVAAARSRGRGSSGACQVGACSHARALMRALRRCSSGLARQQGGHSGDLDQCKDPC